MKIFLKTYRGYANEHEIVVFGHLFKNYSPDQFDLNSTGFTYAFNMIKQFTLKTVPHQKIVFSYKNITSYTTTTSDGYFQLRATNKEPLASGWYMGVVSTTIDGYKVSQEIEFIKPYPGEYGLISDIDDTFLVSHSNRILKKIYVILTKNISRRNFFPNVQEHYRLLSKAGRKNSTSSNVFFYVSSSEWNLYNLISGLTKKNNFPKAVILLRKLKTGLKDFINSGQGNHNHKLEKIRNVITFYPELTFILLGDDSQQDPFIYEKIASEFPGRLTAVYIRQTTRKKKGKISDIINGLNKNNIRASYSKDSDEAIRHSREIGLL